MQQIKKRQILSQAKGQENMVDALESKILEQEADISNMENRNFFSLHCLQMETQLVHANIKMIAVALEKMVASNSLGHKEVPLSHFKLLLGYKNLILSKLSLNLPVFIFLHNNHSHRLFDLVIKWLSVLINVSDDFVARIPVFHLFPKWAICILLCGIV
jgi:hypothetical protein